MKHDRLRALRIGAQAGARVALLIMLGGFTASARATESGWRFHLGAGAIAGPKYPGSNHLDVFFFPDVEAAYGDWFFANPIDGIGVGFSPMKNLTLGAALGVDLDERQASDDPRLQGLGDIGYAPDARLNAHYDFNGLFLDGTLHARLGPRSGRGISAELDAGTQLYTQGSHYVSAGLTCSWMDQQYARNFFGVSATQAAASGRHAFRAQAGLKDAGAFVECSRGWDSRWEYFIRVQVSQLLRPVAHSPIVEQALQPSLEFTLAYGF